MARKSAVASVAWMLFALAVSKTSAQDTLTAELYGQGVHAYYAGNFAQAHESLTTAVDQGTKDPRCYYFRGLTYARLGRPDETQADFKKGAELEASGATPQIDVGQSLQRVQGTLRLELEKYRAAARLATRLRESTQRRERYEEFNRDETTKLREIVPATPSSQPGVGAAAVEPPPAPGLNDPFAIPPKPEAEAGPEAPAPTLPVAPGTGDPPAGANADPFAAPPAAGDQPAEPAGNDPFATPPAVAPAPAPGAQETAPADADPFGAPEAGEPPPAPAGNDPLGDPTKPVAAPEMAPEKETAAPVEADLFGAPAASVPDDTKPAASPAGDDPFGAAVPAPNEAATDPFGGPAAPDAGKPAGAPAAKPAAKGGATNKNASKAAAKNAKTVPDEKVNPFADDPLEEKKPGGAEKDAPGAKDAAPQDPFGAP